jgi:threonine/homoserine/homoserine lactone efflux protein
MTSILRQAMDSGIGAALLIMIGCQSLIMVAVTTLMGSVSWLSERIHILA